MGHPKLSVREKCPLCGRDCGELIIYDGDKWACQSCIELREATNSPAIKVTDVPRPSDEIIEKASRKAKASGVSVGEVFCWILAAFALVVIVFAKIPRPRSMDFHRFQSDNAIGAAANALEEMRQEQKEMHDVTTPMVVLVGALLLRSLLKISRQLDRYAP